MRTVTTNVALESVQEIYSRHLELYKRKRPTYQAEIVRGLAGIWGGHEKVLDVGGGTGVLAQAIHELLNVEVTSIDVHNRFVKGLTIQTETYDGSSIPFADNSFEAVTILDVMHHVPVEDRRRLIQECRRVSRGPIYIKDHECNSRLDMMRLSCLDIIGNMPFGGMVRARYLSRSDWLRLAAETGCEYTTLRGAYHSGAFATVFPNRLQVLMKWLPASELS